MSTPTPETTVPRRLDLTDPALRDEIHLVASLVLAATETPGRLSDREIDRALGLDAGRAGLDQPKRPEM